MDLEISEGIGVPNSSNQLVAKEDTILDCDQIEASVKTHKQVWLKMNIRESIIRQNLGENG